jgi:hypothetical protein
MHKGVLLLGIAVLALVATACGDNPPPTQIVLVVTATPEPGTGTPSTPEPPGTSDTPAAASATATTEPTRLPTNTAQPIPATNNTPQASASPLPAMFPTPLVADYPIAEEVFEHGRTFWLRDNHQIWVMFNVPPDNANGGDWFCFNDTFVEGEAEIDPSLIPPEGMYQPRRGFGKLWRNNPEVKDRLGWALTPEFELTSHYTYLAGGYVENGQYVPGPGEHRLTTLYNESISFFESDYRGDCMGGTWRKGQ